MRKPPYYINYSRPRLVTHNIITSKYFDLAIAAVIGLNVVTMAMEFYMMPKNLEYALRVFNYFFTAVFIVEAVMKMVALGILKYLKNRWNQLDIVIVGLSIAGIVLEKMESDLIPINPTIIRVFRVLRIARVLKLLKMAKGIRALLDTVMQALPQVGNLGLLFFLLFFIFAALGVELFGRLECSEDLPCEGLGEHAHFKDFGMAFLTLFRVATGDNWNGIMKDTLRDNCDYSSDCIRNCCISPIIAPLYFVIFVLMAQFVLVNVVVAVLMKHLEESHKQMDDDLEMDAELERELAQEAAELKARADEKLSSKDKEKKSQFKYHKPLVKMASLPPNFVFPFNMDDKVYRRASLCTKGSSNTTDCVFSNSCDLPRVSPNFLFPLLQPTSPNVNIHQASPDEAKSKVSVANLSPGPLQCGPDCRKWSLTVPSGAFSSHSSPTKLLNYDYEANQTRAEKELPASPVDDWACVFQSMNSDPYKVHFLPVLRNGVIGSTSLCDNKLLESYGVNRERSSLAESLGVNRGRTALLEPPGVNRERSATRAFLPLKPAADLGANPLSEGTSVLDDSLRTGTSIGTSSSQGLLSFPSVFSEKNIHGETEPLIFRRLRKKLLTLERKQEHSQPSSQSDAPNESKHQSHLTDSNSLDS